MTQPIVTSESNTHLKICVPRQWPDEEALLFAKDKTKKVWKLSNKIRQCPDNNGHVHLNLYA